MTATAGYLRVSSDKQDVLSQRQSIERWAKRNEPIALWFEDSIGRNPRDLPHKRVGFQQLLKAVEAGLVSTIVVDSQDRFGTRDAYQWGAFLTTLRDNDCCLIDASGNELSADDDAAVLTGTVGALTSTREQREKAGRNVRGKIVKAQLGEYPGGYPPFGFDVVCIGANDREKWRTVYVAHFDRWKVLPDGSRERFKGKDNAPAKDPSDRLYLRPTIETQRLDVVRQIFKWYATEAISPQQIATRLYQAKIDPVFGDSWNKVKIRQLLGNPIYVGLPTWNKRGTSRFVEFVGGEVRRVKQGAKGGRARGEADRFQPDKPAFKPIVSAKIWERVQEKLAAGSAEQKAITKRSAKTDELWLKPFLICARCEKPMRASRGSDKTRIVDSYFCGTYGTHGKENPTGCRCHRVHHQMLEAIVEKYVTDTSPKTAELLAAVETGDLQLSQPLLQALLDSQAAFNGVACDMMTFVADHATAKEEKGRDFIEAYSLVYARMKPQLDAEIAKRESELDAMLDSYGDLTGGLRERARKRMEAAQTALDQVRQQAADLRTPWGNVKAELTGRRGAYQQAVKVLGNSSGGRHKAEAISRIIDKIVCHFRHSASKSHLDRVEIVPVSGEIVCFTQSIMPAPD